MLLADLPPNLPVLFLATAKVPQTELEEQVASIFGSSMYVPCFCDLFIYFKTRQVNNADAIHKTVLFVYNYDGSNLAAHYTSKCCGCITYIYRIDIKPMNYF